MLDVYNSIRDAANLPPIIDGRHSLMLQERWEGSVLASILAFFFAIWTVRSMHGRGVHFFSFLEVRDLVLVSFQCPWLVRCCPTRSHRPRRQDQVCPPLPTPGVTIYRSDGACRGQGTIAESLADWGAAVWSADARGFGAGFAYATARGFLGNDYYSNNQADHFALLQCLFRALRLQDPHVIFEVDSLILAKQLARHLPGLVVLKISLLSINNVYMFVIPFQLFTSRRTFVIFTVSLTRPQIHCLIRRSTSVIRMVFQHFGSVQSAHHVYLSFPSVALILSDFPTTLECQILCTCLLCTSHSACQKNPNDFFEYICHMGCAITLHSIMDSGLMPGGQILSKRQTVFFTSVDPMNKEHKDPDEIDLNASRLARYKPKVWKKQQNTVYWVDLKLAQEKGFKFYQTRSNAIILYDTLPAYCIPKAIMMKSGEVIVRENICVTSTSSKDFL